jgi:hypothetical protein
VTLSPPAKRDLTPGQPGPCQWCETLMPWDAELAFWQCPKCRAAEFPPEPPEPLPEPGFRTIEDLWQDEQRYKRSISKPGGGEKAGRKRRKPVRRWWIRLITELSDDSRK